jgi:hypothetical protein
MDIMDVIREQEEIDALLFREEFMTDLERKTVMQLQDEAMGAYEHYDRKDSVEAMACIQAAMLAQIALALGQINTHLEAMSRRQEAS